MRVISLRHQALLTTILTCLSIAPAIALISNQTIDDTFGDSLTGQKVLYLPSTAGVWKNQSCTDCAINPDITQTFDHSYTAATYGKALGSISATLTFHGTAIYVFFILANNAGPGITTMTAANFTLDNQPPQFRLHAPDVTTTNIQYNVMIYSQTGLPAAQHTLVMSTSGVDNDVYVNFDYALYTHDDAAVVIPSPPPSSSTQKLLSALTSRPLPTTASHSTSAIPSTTNSADDTNGDSSSTTSGGAIAGIIIGTFVAIALILGAFICRRRQRRRDIQPTFEKAEIDPPISEASVQSGPSASMNPFHQNSSSSTTHLMLQIPSPRPPPATQIPVTPSDAGDPYGGYITPTSMSAHTTPSGDQRSQPLRLVNRASTVPSIGNSEFEHEDLRRARQEELNHQLAAMQQEMLELSSGLDRYTVDSSEDAGTRQYVRSVSLKSLRHVRMGSRSARGEGDGGSSSSSVTGAQVGEMEGDTEVSVVELRELIQTMRLEIEYLKMQQQSAWAQGLSDDPPPGYTTATVSRRTSRVPKS